MKLVSSGNHPFTGIFKGADYGFIRHSVARPYFKIKKDLAPGFALKFLRDGVDSANVVAVHSLDGQTSWNYFGIDWSNQVAKPVSKAIHVLLNRFVEYTPYLQAVGTSDFAKYDQHGKAEANPVFPFSLRFAPS